METLKASIFSFIIVNLVNKVISQFNLFITNGYTKECILLWVDSWVEHSNKTKKNAKCINFQFHNLKFCQERYFELS